MKKPKLFQFFGDEDLLITSCTGPFLKIGYRSYVFPGFYRSKFRAKVLAEHPDKGGDPKKFQMLNKAYNVLTDTEKRRRYDTTGRAEKSAEEEFVEGFAGGRHHFEPRTKEKSWKTKNVENTWECLVFPCFCAYRPDLWQVP